MLFISNENQKADSSAHTVHAHTHGTHAHTHRSTPGLRCDLTEVLVNTLYVSVTVIIIPGLKNQTDSWRWCFEITPMAIFSPALLIEWNLFGNSQVLVGQCLDRQKTTQSTKGHF